jgi:CHAT domain-containing protein
LNRALKVNRETGSVLGEGQSLLALCRTYRLADNPTAAADYCAQALTLAEAHGHEAQRARASIELGDAYLELGQLDRAAGYFQAGRELAHELDRPNIQWPAAAGMARVLAAQGRTEPAVAMGREAVATLERLRSQLELPEMRAGFLEDKLDPYEQLVLLLARQGLLSEAFRTMEYSRSRTFLEVLADAPGNAASERSSALRRRIYDMRREILDRTEDLAELPASADRDSATTAVLGILSQLRKQHDALQAEMLRELPEESAGGAEPLALEAVQAMLGSSEAVLEYYVTRNDLLIFLITKDGVRAIIQSQSETQLAARVKLYQAAVSSDPGLGGGSERWLAPATALTQVLLDPVRRDPLLAGRDRLIVVPHRFLNLVPFQALLGRRSSPGEPAHFLVEDYALSYAPSASVLKHCRDHARSRRLTALALANPTPRLSGSTELMYAADEVAAVKRHFGEQAVVRVGLEATETQLKGAVGTVDLLHLATHYEVDERDPMRSALNLAPSSLDDGRLEVREVMGLGVVADLVVVSGCSTANGEIAGECPAGDDWVGLTRAFLHAGAPSVLGTLWPVNDRSSARFMDSFYEFLPAAGKGGAVAAAQREMLGGRVRGGSDLQDPYYWAPFVLIGAAN